MKNLPAHFDIAIRTPEALQATTRRLPLGSLVESLRDKDLALVGHSHRVAFYADLLAHRLRLPEEEVGQVRVAAFLHDIGKLGVDRDILLKPAKLESTEVRAMRRHPALGARILQDLSLSGSVISGVLHHHEWWEGSGYPLGLARNRIPRASRIIAVCDAFDSMDNHRPYRRALPRSASIEELQKFSGRQFEPVLVSEFLHILETGVCDPPLPFRVEADGAPDAEETPARAARRVQSASTTRSEPLH